MPAGVVVRDHGFAELWRDAQGYLGRRSDILSLMEVMHRLC